MRNPPGFSNSSGQCMLVTGEAVIASDAFKTWVFGLKNIIGGESKTFARLFGRARREALFLRYRHAVSCNRHDCAWNLQCRCFSCVFLAIDL